jgi:hypothetical protein
MCCRNVHWFWVRVWTQRAEGGGAEPKQWRRSHPGRGHHPEREKGRTSETRIIKTLRKHNEFFQVDSQKKKRNHEQGKSDYFL